MKNNILRLIGTLKTEVDYRETNGVQRASFILETTDSREFKVFARCVAWEELALKVSQNYKQGDSIHLLGELRSPKNHSNFALEVCILRLEAK